MRLINWLWSLLKKTISFLRFHFLNVHDVKVEWEFLWMSHMWVFTCHLVTIFFLFLFVLGGMWVFFVMGLFWVMWWILTQIEILKSHFRDGYALDKRSSPSKILLHSKQYFQVLPYFNIIFKRQCHQIFIQNKLQSIRLEKNCWSFFSILILFLTKFCKKKVFSLPHWKATRKELKII